MVNYLLIIKKYFINKFSLLNKKLIKIFNKLVIFLEIMWIISPNLLLISLSIFILVIISYFKDFEMESTLVDSNVNRLLTVDNKLVLPYKSQIRNLITSNDVLHSWSTPNLGYKMDACPGRLNEISFRSNILGTVFGQCSEICGINHAFMPIVLRFIEGRHFLSWLVLSGANFRLMGLECNRRILPKEFIYNFREGHGLTDLRTDPKNSSPTLYKDYLLFGMSDHIEGKHIKRVADFITNEADKYMLLPTHPDYNIIGQYRKFMIDNKDVYTKENMPTFRQFLILRVKKSKANGFSDLIKRGANLTKPLVTRVSFIKYPNSSRLQSKCSAIFNPHFYNLKYCYESHNSSLNFKPTEMDNFTKESTKAKDEYLEELKKNNILRGKRIKSPRKKSSGS